MAEATDDKDAPPSNISVLAMCRCGRAPHRKNQRNCHFCNVEANKKYRRSLKRQIEAFRTIREKIEQAC